MADFNDLMDQFEKMKLKAIIASQGDPKAAAEVLSALINAHAAHALAQSIRDAGDRLERGLNAIKGS
jgi:hypothetical protein